MRYYIGVATGLILLAISVAPFWAAMEETSTQVAEEATSTLANNAGDMTLGGSAPSVLAAREGDDEDSSYALLSSAAESHFSSTIVEAAYYARMPETPSILQVGGQDGGRFSATPLLSTAPGLTPTPGGSSPLTVPQVNTADNSMLGMPTPLGGSQAVRQDLAYARPNAYPAGYFPGNGNGFQAGQSPPPPMTDGSGQYFAQGYQNGGYGLGQANNMIAQGPGYPMQNYPGFQGAQGYGMQQQAMPLGLPYGGGCNCGPNNYQGNLGFGMMGGSYPMSFDGGSYCGADLCCSLPCCSMPCCCPPHHRRGLFPRLRAWLSGCHEDDCGERRGLLARLFCRHRDRDCGYGFPSGCMMY